MEALVSEILENILGLLGLEGSFEVVEGAEEVAVTIETEDAGRLIGYRGETVDALQLLVNQIVGKKAKEAKLEYKRVVVDVGSWRKNKEGDLENRARDWAEEALESGEELELEPMPAWQRRVVHLVVEGITGVKSESVGEGRDRHLVIKPTASKKQPSKRKTSTKTKAVTEQVTESAEDRVAEPAEEVVAEAPVETKPVPATKR